jgi:hypothetical protein
MHAWLLRERKTLSRSSEVLKPINYMLRRWDDFARFDDGRICSTNNCAERALRGIAVGRRNWTFAGSQRGADRAAIMLTMITTGRLNERRSQGLARRHPRLHCRSARLAPARTAPVGMEAPAPGRQAHRSAGRLTFIQSIIDPTVLARRRQSGGLRRMRTHEAPNGESARACLYM